LLSDGEITSVRVVLNPERMVIKEAQRAYTYLNLYGYSVDAVVVNRVFPVTLEDDFFSGWKVAQAKGLELVREAFQPLPIFEVPYFDQEVTGSAMLERMAQTLFGDATVQGGAGDPTNKQFVGRPQTIERVGDRYVLSIALPLVDRSDVHLHRSVFDELVVRIGNWKRNITLPMGLAKLDIAGAKYEGDRLNISFVRPAGAAALTDEELKPNRWQALKERFSNGKS
jgi:arsenite-transporting ATPase